MMTNDIKQNTRSDNEFPADVPNKFYNAYTYMHACTQANRKSDETL